MSRNNPEVNLQNPAVKFFDWAGDTGQIEYYDREEKKNIKVNFPFRFLVLDVVYQVAGGFKNGKDYVGYFSNAIKPRTIKTAEFIVKSKVNGQTRIEGQGVWADLKNSLHGAKFMTGLYIGFFDDEGEMRIGFLKLKGAANSAWIEFNQKIGRRDVCQGAYTLKERSEELQSGNTTYFEPRFTWTDQVKPDTEDAAKHLDDVLQEYLTPYFAQVKEPEQEYSGPTRGDAYEDPEPRQAAAPTTPLPEDDIPF